MSPSSLFVKSSRGLSSSLLIISAIDLMTLGNVYILFAMDNLNLSSISRLNSLISSQFCLSVSVALSECSRQGLFLLLRRESSSSEQCYRLERASSSSSYLNSYIITFITKQETQTNSLPSYHYPHDRVLIQNQLTPPSDRSLRTINSMFCCTRQSRISMNNLPYYISKQFIANIPGEQVLEHYEGVQVIIDDMKIVGMRLEITTHRLLFKSTTHHALQIKGEIVRDVSISEQGFFSKTYFVKMHTQYGKVKLGMKSFNQARINIDNMIKKQAWLQKHEEKKVQTTKMYSGMFEKVTREKEKITTQSAQVSQSFSSFDSLFGNLRDIKKIMNEMKSVSGQSDGDNPEVNKILKDMGFVSVIEKDESGKDFYRKLANDLYQVCTSTLFKNFGGVVALLDLYYFYNKKRQMNLLAPEEMLKACQMFPSLGLNAKIVRYPNNIILIESTTFDANADFQENYAKYFKEFNQGLTADEISRRKGLPVAIVDIKLRQACKSGKLAVADRIEGIKFYKNMLLAV